MNGHHKMDHGDVQSHGEARGGKGGNQGAGVTDWHLVDADADKAQKPCLSGGARVGGKWSNERVKEV